MKGLGNHTHFQSIGFAVHVFNIFIEDSELMILLGRKGLGFLAGFS